MQQLTSNVHIETRQKGANHGLVATSDGLVLIDTPHKPSDAVRLRSEIERRGKLALHHQYRAPWRSLDR